MTDFHLRLASERKRLGLNQSDFGALGGVTKDSQLNYEKGTRRPDSAYLEAVAAHGVDVGYLLTGMRARAVNADYEIPTFLRRAAANSDTSESAAGQQASEPMRVVRELTPEEAALLDNYNAADERGRAAARSVLDALAKPKKCNG